MADAMPRTYRKVVFHNETNTVMDMVYNINESRNINKISTITFGIVNLDILNSTIQLP